MVHPKYLNRRLFWKFIIAHIMTYFCQYMWYVTMWICNSRRLMLFSSNSSGCSLIFHLQKAWWDIYKYAHRLLCSVACVFKGLLISSSMRCNWKWSVSVHQMPQIFQSDRIEAKLSRIIPQSVINEHVMVYSGHIEVHRGHIKGW